jgi:hypothetical protein
MEEAPKSKEEMIEHLMQRFRKLLGACPSIQLAQKEEYIYFWCTGIFVGGMCRSSIYVQEVPILQP